MTLTYTPLAGAPRTGGVPLVGGPREWVRAGLIGPRHPATRGGRWLCVQFGVETVCAPQSRFRLSTEVARG